MREAAIRVMLVDDHQLVRETLQEVLASDPMFEVVAAVGSAVDAFAVLAQAAPDVILMDVRMPGIDGIEATRTVLSLDPRPRVVMLSSTCNGRQVRDALAAGASGYLVKDMDVAALSDAVRVVAGGGTFLTPLAGSLAAANDPDRARWEWSG